MNKTTISTSRIKTKDIHWKSILPICMLGFFGLLMEYYSFNHLYFNGNLWIIPVVFLSVSLLCIEHKKMTVSFSLRWMIIGSLFWNIWRLIYWIFATRGLSLHFFLAIILLPITKLLNVSGTIYLLFSMVFFLLSIVGFNWIGKNYNKRWAKLSGFIFFLFLMIIASISIYTGQSHFSDNCHGNSALNNGTFCYISSNLGIVGTMWVTMIFMIWALTHGLKTSTQNGILSSICIIAMQPIWIEIFFNPSRILYVPWQIALITPGKYSDYAADLPRIMSILNIIPIIAFFIIIPVGLVVMKSEKFRKWWVLVSSAITMLLILWILLHTLNSSEAVFEYSTRDYVIFVLMAIMVWLPLLIFTVVSEKAAENKLEPEEDESHVSELAQKS